MDFSDWVWAWLAYSAIGVWVAFLFRNRVDRGRVGTVSAIVELWPLVSVAWGVIVLGDWLDNRRCN